MIKKFKKSILKKKLIFDEFSLENKDHNHAYKVHILFKDYSSENSQ